MELLDPIDYKAFPPTLRLILGEADLDSEHDEDLLTGYESDELSSLSNPRRRQEFIANRHLIKQLAGDMGMEPENFEVMKDGLGKPYGVYGNTRYYVSMAHAGSRLFCGICADRSIGIDLEPVGRNVSSRLRARICHPKEDRLDALSTVRIWTIKEAMVKLEGQGLRTNLQDLYIEPQGETLFRGRFDNDKSAIICSFRHGDFWLAVGVMNGSQNE